jgi:hypothetical protein
MSRWRKDRPDRSVWRYVSSGGRRRSDSMPGLLVASPGCGCFVLAPGRIFQDSQMSSLRSATAVMDFWDYETLY